MLAATLADGHTVIRPAAQEPEVDDLMVFLREMGAEVERTWPDTIEVHGKRRLRGAEHRIIPDRIEAGTFAVAGAVTGGHVTLTGAPCDHLTAFVEVLGRAGVGRPDCDTAAGVVVDGRALGRGGFRACDIRTAPYPGLATDLQPPTCVLLTQATGRRRSHGRSSRTASEWLSELNRMGARIEIPDNHHATIRGRTPLHGADADIGDLRAGRPSSSPRWPQTASRPSTVRTTSSAAMRTSSASSPIWELGSRASKSASKKGLSPPP
jgi:UDP-N-acetylglucosamine 1-carboxyvinyltransferase